MANRNDVSRRQFVKSAAAIAVAAPTIISARALGDETTPPPSERLTLGFIGLGKQGLPAHLNPFSSMKNVQILAVCDVHTGRRERAKRIVAEKYEKAKREGKIDEYIGFMDVINRKDIDALVIATPDHWHTAISIEACKAGKDIYCEKPLTLTIHEARVIIDAVRKTGRVFQTGSQQRSTGPFREACEYVRNGRIGKIKEVHVGLPGGTSKPCDLPGEPTPEGIDWDVWLGQAPQREYSHVLCHPEDDPSKYPFNPGWRDYREFSGGMITDWGAHHFDITQWALDMDHSGPVEILPPENEDDLYGAKFIYRGSPVGDEITVTHVKDVWEGPTKDRKTGEIRNMMQTNGILFIGDKGRIFVNREMIASEPDSILKDPIGENDVHLRKSPQNNHHLDWMDCIKTRQRPIADVEIGSRSVTVCHLVNLAYWYHRKLNWDPQKWEFPGDAEANGWRTRPRRGKYQLPTV
jgi:predicted dehydrogenase